MSTGNECPSPATGKTLILCFDGTSNEYDADNTNVVKFVSLLKKVKCDEQVVYYQPGIGVWFNPGVVSPILSGLAKVLDLAFAWYMDAHVIEGYKFVMQNYKEGDRICLFGFSRGAYTARALAGCLYKIGLLPPYNEQQVPGAYKLFKREDQEGLELAAGYKQTFCRDVKIDFVGVWDTVSSVGVIMSRTLPFSNSNKSIKVFRHALSLDERRAKFRPNQYHRPAPDESEARKDPQQASSPTGGATTHSERQPLLKRLTRKKAKTYVAPAQPPSEEEGPDTDVLELWFSGCHSDVGGGATANSVDHCLSNIPLRWMVGEVMKAQVGVLFDEAALARMSIPAVIFPGTEIENTPAIIELDKVDALEPLHDQLKSNPLWWLLEIIPLTYVWQDANGVWHREFGFNFGRGRKIEDAHPLFHQTVEQRIQDPKLKYKPRARFAAGTEIYTR